MEGIEDERNGEMEDMKMEDIENGLKEEENKFIWFRNQWGNIPPPLGGHSAILLKRSGRTQFIIIFGGNADLSQARRPSFVQEPQGGKNTFLNSVYGLNTVTMKWREIIPIGIAPVARYGHSATLLQKNILIFGGVDNFRVQKNDIFLLKTNGKAEEWEWTELHHKSEIVPEPRYGHTLTAVGDDFVLLGGTCDDQTIYSLSVINSENCFWSPLHPGGIPPSPRAYHAAASASSGEHHYLIIFGGRDSQNVCLNDLHVLDFDMRNSKQTWLQPQTQGTPPCPRFNHSMVIVKKKLYVFGGSMMENGTVRSLNDLHILDIVDLTWSTPPTIGEPPLPRSRHTCTAVDSKLFIFGGTDQNTWLSDLVVLETRKVKFEDDRPHLPKENYLISETLHHLNENGVSIVSNARAHLTKSYETLSVMGRNELRQSTHLSNICSSQILQLLEKDFVPIPSYNYQRSTSSHQWRSEESRQEFAACLIELCREAIEILQNESTLLRLSSPTYVLGDLHGNYKDLKFFAQSLWKFSVTLCPASLLFLGDYVDRGPHSVELIAYLLALKINHPEKVFLLRGNHECKDVNGNVQGYGPASFYSKCDEFPNGIGTALWEAFNACFDVMPLAATIDNEIFCVHGGVPRKTVTSKNILEEIEKIKKPCTLEDLTNDSNDKYPLSYDLLWSDPAPSDTELEMEAKKVLFVANPRGGNSCLFGKEALKEFFRKSGCTHIIRAHQPPKLGINIQKGAKLVTVFSSSHYCGGYNSAAGVLVADHRLRIMIVNPTL